MEQKRYSGLGALVPFLAILVLVGGVSLYNSYEGGPGATAFDPNALPPTAAGPVSHTMPEGCGPVESVAVVHRICRAVADFVRVTSDEPSR